MFKHHEKIREYILSSVAGALDGHHVEKIEGQSDAALIEQFEGDIFSSLLSFEHPNFRGGIMLCCGDDVLATTCPGLRFQNEEERYAQLEDWAGEMTNLIAGRFKNFMMDHDVRVSIRPPSVSRSPASILENYAKRLPSEMFWFKIKGLQFCVQFSAEISEEVDFYVILGRHTTLLRPGDVVMSLNEVQKVPAVEKGLLPLVSRTDVAASSIGEFSGLAWLDNKRVALSFHSGAEIRIDINRIMDNGGERTISVGGLEVGIIYKQSGFDFSIDGISIFLPLRSA